jgi:nucleotide-binding universal stress UspA family protein
MFENVIVGVDGEEGGRDAIALAECLRSREGEVAFAYVYESDSRAWTGSTSAFELAERERAGDLLLKATQESGVDAQIRRRKSSSVGRGLHELAERLEADLLVIGSSARGLAHRVLVGDETRAALNGAPCPVALAPVGFRTHPPVVREIGVGYDGSPESQHALAIGRELATAHGAKLSAFQAVSLPARFARRAADEGTSVQDMVDEARERISALGGVEPHAAYGNPAEELALYGASLDLLVIGSRGYGPLGRLLHGSTTQELARTARCPLLVLTRAAREHFPADDSADEERSLTSKG